MSEPYGSIEALINHALNGWSERIEYKATVYVHTAQCIEQRDLMHLCSCPTTIENRAAVRRQQSLCIQLRASRFAKRVTVKDTGGGHPGKASKKPPPPGNLVEPDDILYRFATTAREALGPVTPYVLSRPFADDAEQWLLRLRQNLQALNRSQLADVTRKMDRVVRSARILLGYESDTVQFANTLCGDCGGALAAQRHVPTEVRCVGGPTQDPCGRVYGWQSWGELLAAGPVLVDTKTASSCLGRPAATLYRWASTGKVTRYGDRKQGAARWDLDELKEYQEALDKRSKKSEDTS